MRSRRVSNACSGEPGEIPDEEVNARLGNPGLFRKGARAMQPFRASLRDDAGQAIADVEGSIQAPEEAEGARRGSFEVQETGAFMQGVLDGTPFRLGLDDGSWLTIKVDSVSASASPGYSVVAFTTA